jgi:hypothetical protein
MALIKTNARGQSSNLGRRNLVINGDFQVAQRATSVTSQTASGYKTVDRLYTNASGATYSQSQQTVTVGGETGLPLQFSKFLRHQVTTGNNWSQVYQKIEDVSSVPAGTVTLSFYAKGTSPDGGLSFIAWQNFGSGGSSEVTVTISPTVTLTSTWQRFTVNITVPSITGKTIGTGSHFYFGIGQGGSTSTNAWTLDMTGLQLETGSVATDFEHRSYGEELSLCQRYYELIGFGNIALAESGSTYVHNLNYKVEKRAVPTISLFTTSNIRIRQFGISDRDAASPNPTSTAGSKNGGYVKVSGFNGIGGAATAAGIGYTTSSEAGNIFYISAEL